jgi:hypothetical protein
MWEWFNTIWLSLLRVNKHSEETSQMRGHEGGSWDLNGPFDMGGRLDLGHDLNLLREDGAVGLFGS